MCRNDAAVASQMGAGGSEMGGSGLLEVADSVDSKCLEESGRGCRSLLPPPQASPAHGDGRHLPGSRQGGIQGQKGSYPSASIPW